MEWTQWFVPIFCLVMMILVGCVMFWTFAMPDYQFKKAKGKNDE